MNGSHRVSSNVDSLMLMDSPISQPAAAHTQRPQATPEGSCSTIDSPPLPPSPRCFRWRTGDTPLYEPPSHVGNPTSYAAVVQTTTSLRRPCDWIDCTICSVPMHDRHSETSYRKRRPSTVNRGGCHDTRARVVKAVPELPSGPSHRRHGPNVLGEFSAARKVQDVFRSHPEQRAGRKRSSARRKPPIAGDGRGHVGLPTHKRRPADSSLGHSARQGPPPVSSRDERTDEFVEVATLLGLIRLA